MKVGFVVGHNSKDKGAYSDYLSISEYDFYSAVAEKIALRCKNLDVEVIKREYYGSYSKEMQKVVDYVNSNNFDLVIELHYNAYNGLARGVEMLYFHKSAKGKKVADDLIELHTTILGIPKRRSIPVESSGDRGGYGIVKSKMTYVLTESFFGDNAEDCKRVSVDKIADIFVQYLGGDTAVEPENPSQELPNGECSCSEKIKTLEEKIARFEKILSEIKEVL